MTLPPLLRCVLLTPLLAAGCIFSNATPSAKGTADDRWRAAGSRFLASTEDATAARSSEGELAESQQVARLGIAPEGTSTPAPPWREGTPHPVAPHVESARAPETWRPAPGYTIRDQRELTVQWVPGQRHRDEPGLVAGDVEGEWVPLSPGAETSKETSAPATGPDRVRDRNKEKAYSSFAKALSSPWFSGGRFHRPAPNPMESVERVMALDAAGLRELERAQESYVDVAYFEQRAWDLQGGFSATPQELELLAESFVAALLDDQATLSVNLVETIRDLPSRTRRIERSIEDGHDAACRATRDLGSLWREHLIGLARELAGPQTLRRGCKWAVALSPNPVEGGLAVVNDTGKQLRDVTIAVHSELAGASSGFEDYYVHLATFARGQRLVLPIELVLAVFEQQPRARFEGKVTYSVWAREGRLEDITLELPRSEYEQFRTNAKIPKELVLRSDG